MIVAELASPNYSINECILSSSTTSCSDIPAWYTDEKGIYSVRDVFPRFLLHEKRSCAVFLLAFSSFPYYNYIYVIIT